LAQDGAENHSLKKDQQSYIAAPAGVGRGGGRGQEWSEHGKKKGPLTWRGAAREGDASGGTHQGSEIETTTLKILVSW